MQFLRFRRCLRYERLCIWIITAVFLVTIRVHAESPPADVEPIDPDGIRGALVLCGGGRLPDEVRDRFMELAGATSAQLVIIPTASGDDTIEQDGRELLEIWGARQPKSIALLHTRDREQANQADFTAPLREATGVWISGGRQSQIAAAYSGTLVEKELAALVERGGVVGGTSAGAACQSRVMIVRGEIFREPGLGLLPGTIIDQHFVARNRRDRLLAALTQYPHLVGLGIDEGTACIVRGRDVRCLGDSTVTICLTGTGNRTARTVELSSGQATDLTMYRREARDRTRPPFPPEMPVKTEVPAGSLVIVGGGGLPDQITQKFIELAGGPEALIVVLPTANPLSDRTAEGESSFFTKAGAKNVKVLSARRRHEVSSPDYLAILKEARGVWFGGGRQWRFVDAYEGTPAIEAFRDVLQRGGVIGGSSAGATIQGDYLVRGSPLGNEEMMAAGYERGFAFLPGTAIDQHFSQRRRFADMTRVVTTHPQLLGIGIDEATALVVRGSTAEVMGNNKVHFYDRNRTIATGEPDYVSISPGEKFDLAARKPIVD